MKKNIILSLYASVFSVSSFGSASDHTMHIGNEALSPQQQRALENLSNPIQVPLQTNIQKEEEKKPTSDQKVIPTEKIQGTLDGVTNEGHVKQKFGKATAVDKVTQGDIQESTLGSTTQTFGKATAQNVSQGNVKGTTISGDLEQTFGDDD